MRYSTSLYRFNIGPNPGSEATQLMSQDIPSLAPTLCVITHLFGGVGSQGVLRMKPAEFIRPKQAMIWLCERKALHQLRV